MVDKPENITIDILKTLLEQYFPEHRQRIVHGKNLHDKDLRYLLDEMIEFKIDHPQLLHALKKLQPHYKEIESDYKRMFPYINNSDFYTRKMYRVGMARLMLDVTYPEYRRRNTNGQNMISMLNKWLDIGIKGQEY